MKRHSVMLIAGVALSISAGLANSTASSAQTACQSVLTRWSAEIAVLAELRASLGSAKVAVPGYTAMIDAPGMKGSIKPAIRIGEEMPEQVAQAMTDALAKSCITPFLIAMDMCTLTTKSNTGLFRASDESFNAEIERQLALLTRVYTATADSGCPKGMISDETFDAVRDSVEGTRDLASKSAALIETLSSDIDAMTTRTEKIQADQQEIVKLNENVQSALDRLWARNAQYFTASSDALKQIRNAVADSAADLQRTALRILDELGMQARLLRSVGGEVSALELNQERGFVVSRICSMYDATPYQTRMTVEENACNDSDSTINGSEPFKNATVRVTSYQIHAIPEAYLNKRERSYLDSTKDGRNIPDTWFDSRWQSSRWAINESDFPNYRNTPFISDNLKVASAAAYSLKQFQWTGANRALPLRVVVKVTVKDENDTSCGGYFASLSKIVPAIDSLQWRSEDPIDEGLRRFELTAEPSERAGCGQGTRSHAEYAEYKRRRAIQTTWFLRRF